MGCKLGYHILVLPNQVLLINSVLTNKVLLYVLEYMHTVFVSLCGGELWVDQRKMCADICDVAQVTDYVHTLPN